MDHPIFPGSVPQFFNDGETDAGKQRIANIKLLGALVFEGLPMWAKLLDWKEGAPDPDEAGERIALYVGRDGRVYPEIVGDLNKLGGCCDCCREPWADAKAWASIEIQPIKV